MLEASTKNQNGARSRKGKYWKSAKESYKVNYILKEITIPWKITTAEASHFEI